MTSEWTKRRSSWAPHHDDDRSPFDVDFSRIVHSGSFRRLQGKTQILSLGDSDFYRTRLTHSLEVAQIASGLLRQLSMRFTNHPACKHLPCESLVQAIGFAHDLGHPPFGHAGEVALNYCMRNHGGFEGNGQTLRILTKLERFSANDGSDLTRRSLLGVLKYPAPYSEVVNPKMAACMNDGLTSIRLIDRQKSKPPKCFFDSEKDVVDWVLEPLLSEDRKVFCSSKPTDRHRKPFHKSFDCSIMDLADDIAYGVHDLEDVIALRLVDEKQFRAVVSQSACETYIVSRQSKDGSDADDYDSFVQGLFGEQRKRKISRLINYFMTNVGVDEVTNLKEPLIRYRATIPQDQRKFLDSLKQVVVNHVIKGAHVQQLELKGQKMVVSVFEALESDPTQLLPADHREKFEQTGNDIRVICDYVAGMTDGFLLKTYNRLFSPGMGSVFDML
jgi:dGTPase